MNKQLSVMGLAARASMVPVLIASGLTALAVGVLTYLANPENTGGAAGVGFGLVGDHTAGVTVDLIVIFDVAGDELDFVNDSAVFVISLSFVETRIFCVDSRVI